MRLTRAELRHIMWTQMDTRVAAGVTEQQMLDILSYKSDVRSLPANPVNRLRDEIIDHIQKNKDRLSLPCDGECYQHPDGMVIHCHMALKEG